MNTAVDNLFEIKHHSPSSISSFIEYKHQWYLQKIRKVKFPGSHPMARGKAVEEGLNYFLANDDASLEDCIKAGLKLWGEEIMALGENFDFRQSLGKCISKAIDSFKERGYDDGKTEMQNKINITFEGCDLPTIGFLDYLRPDRLIDNKCVSKTPSLDKATGLYKQKQGYIIQAAVYEKATGMEPFFHYVIPQKDDVKIVEARFSKEDLTWGLKYATKAAQAIEKILANPVDGELMQAFMFPNMDAIFNGTDMNIVMNEYGL